MLDVSIINLFTCCLPGSKHCWLENPLCMPLKSENSSTNSGTSQPKQVSQCQHPGFYIQTMIDGEVHNGPRAVIYYTCPWLVVTGTCFIFPDSLGISSSQLTNSNLFQRGLVNQPTRSIDYPQIIHILTISIHGEIHVFRVGLGPGLGHNSCRRSFRSQGIPIPSVLYGIYMRYIHKYGIYIYIYMGYPLVNKHSYGKLPQKQWIFPKKMGIFYNRFYSYVSLPEGMYDFVTCLRMFFQCFDCFSWLLSGNHNFLQRLIPIFGRREYP